ncbi:hypothetical protein BDW59DRAFT_140181 [Aspergillus cavernicola]|uniref:Uncharacterized protein n=1 Tax=Aspergillus cavernicola TaxID=176166 RepID=A0ABR4IW09_9EURO
MSSPVLQGWQFNDDSRSSWDIVWTCLTTIFACTWTVLHQPVPGRNKSDGLIIASKLITWLITFLAPEGLAFIAVEEFWQVRSLARRCNAAQATSDRNTGEPGSWLYNRTKPLVNAQDVNDLDLYPVHAEWTAAQCFCIQMGGLTLETEDEWIFYVGRGQVHRFIEAGLVRSSDFTDRDIQDRVKADGFAKAFTVFQSTWVTVNIVARAGYSLPITPFEFSTIAYVACAIIAYALWWNKPQDMTVPITIPVRYTRDRLPQDIRTLTDVYPKRWVHRRVIPSRQSVGKAMVHIGKLMQTVAADEPSGGGLTRASRGLTVTEEWMLNSFAGLSGFIFCGIHVAAWNYAFPTNAEKIAWRVFALTSLAMVVLVYVIAQVPLTTRWLANRGVSPPICMKGLADPNGKFTWTEIYVPIWCILIYAFARFGLVALTLSSLRALPRDAYIAVDWLASIPHI